MIPVHSEWGPDGVELAAEAGLPVKWTDDPGAPIVVRNCPADGDDWGETMRDYGCSRYACVVAPVPIADAHEIGHMLGLEHKTDAANACNLMYFEGVFCPEKELTDEQIERAERAARGMRHCL